MLEILRQSFFLVVWLLVGGDSTGTTRPTLPQPHSLSLLGATDMVHGLHGKLPWRAKTHEMILHHHLFAEWRQTFNSGPRLLELTIP